MLDTSDIHGNAHALRALEIAAAGHHGLLLVGPAAAPKTPIARRLLALIPPPSPTDLLALASIYTASGAHTAPSVRPFRAPHWTASEAGLIGAGGARCLPGEVSLAHAGVLYLENAPEFRRAHLDAVARTIRNGYAFLPLDAHCRPFAARPLVVASADPCPCRAPRGRCVCSPERAHAYVRRVAPLLPLVDLWVEVSAEQHGAAWEASDVVAARVREAQAFRERRGAGPEPEPVAGLLLSVHIGPRGADMLRVSDDWRTRRLRVARTIADLDGSAAILDRHVSEATQLTAGIEALS
jgi:magnesium chelatase family protein